MSAVRFLLAWLLLAALPLQGFAAATTLLCGPAHHGSAAVLAAAGPAAPHPDGDEGHDHAHASGSGMHAALAAGDSLPSASADTGHSCNLCASACHGVGIASQPTQVAPAPAPHVPLTESFQRFDSRPAPVPDKPPRA